jgi:hypothetical protein
MVGAGPAAPRGPGRDEAEPDPFAGRTVLVEAFVVQMDVSLLEEMGVSPLGREPHFATAEGLLERLQSGDASVLLAVRSAAVHEWARGQVRETETTYRPKTLPGRGPGPQGARTSYASYDSGQTLSIEPVVLSESSVRLEYSFEHSGIRSPAAESEAPPETISWSWSSQVSLDAGKPRIVGGTQDEDAAIFLILTAHILD